MRWRSLFDAFRTLPVRQSTGASAYKARTKDEIARDVVARQLGCPYKHTDLSEQTLTDVERLCNGARLSEEAIAALRKGLGLKERK